ncbi:MAG: hypothetical protein H0T60_03740 [Acidobacteria bacterium]|nr:hypothetical protein [Acidobacteriota bacterium]
MKGQRKIKLTILGLVAVALVTSFAALSSQGKTKQKKSTVVELRSQDQLGQDDVEASQVPVADYNAPKPTDAKRKAKNKRHEKKLPAAIDAEGENMPAVSTAHWWSGLSALPADKSAAVVIGEVRNAEAFLADDRTGIYSEFTISISEVLKNDAANPLADSVVVERTGGAVKFPNGRTRAFRLSGMGFPRVGRQYVFFLGRNSGGGDYSILTGYEMRGGKVLPLDGQGKKLRFNEYSGADAEAFLREVRVAVSRSSQPAND